MRLFDSKRRLKALPFVVLILCVSSFLYPSAAEAQNRNEKEKAYIGHKLSQIDSLILNQQYDKAQSIIDNTQNTFSFKKDLESRLEFEFRTARIMYERGDSEAAIEKMLTDFDLLKTRPFAPLNITYASYLAKIFANSQNLNKAI